VLEAEQVDQPDRVDQVRAGVGAGEPQRDEPPCQLLGGGPIHLVGGHLQLRAPVRPGLPVGRGPVRGQLDPRAAGRRHPGGVVDQRDDRDGEVGATLQQGVEVLHGSDGGIRGVPVDEDHDVLGHHAGGAAWRRPGPRLGGAAGRLAQPRPGHCLDLLGEPEHVGRHRALGAAEPLPGQRVAGMRQPLRPLPCPGRVAGHPADDAQVGRGVERGQRRHPAAGQGAGGRRLPDDRDRRQGPQRYHHR